MTDSGARLYELNQDLRRYVVGQVPENNQLAVFLPGQLINIDIQNIFIYQGDIAAFTGSQDAGEHLRQAAVLFNRVNLSGGPGDGDRQGAQPGADFKHRIPGHQIGALDDHFGSGGVL